MVEALLNTEQEDAGILSDMKIVRHTRNSVGERGGICPIGPAGYLQLKCLHILSQKPKHIL